MSSAEAANSAPVILCAGIAVHDLVFSIPHFPAPGMKMRAQRFASVGGGCAANAAVAIARLGGCVRFASPLGGPAGEDAIGDRILADLQVANVDCRAVIRAARAPSPLSAILVDASGERMIVNHRDESLSGLRIADPSVLVQDIDGLLVDNRFSEFVRPLCLAAQVRGIPVVLDGDRSGEQSETLLSCVSHIVFAADGLRATAGTEALEEGLRRMAGRTSAFLAVTDGERGVLWLEQGEVKHLPAYRVTAVDTVGAGDVFHGAFALALVSGQPESEAMEFAAAAAALKCTRFGGISGAPTRPEVDTFVSGVGRAD